MAKNRKRRYGDPIRHKKRPDGSLDWGYDLPVPERQPDGFIKTRRRRMFGYASRAEVEQAVAAIRQRAIAREGETAITRYPTLRELADARLPLLTRRNEHTRATRVFRVLCEVAPPDLPVNRLETPHLRRYISRREQDGVGPSSINREMNIIAALLHMAGDLFPSLRQWVCPKIPRPKVRQSRRERIITEDEYRRIVAHLTRPPDEADGKRGADRQRAHKARLRVARIFQFAMLTAARHGEIVALKWRHVDRERGKISIYQTKTDKWKEIPMTRAIAALLEERDPSTGEYVFTRGGNIYPKFYRILRTACEAAGITYGKNAAGGLVLHAARHTVTTRLVEAGIDYETISLITGHQTKDLIAHYAHKTPASVARAAAALDEYGEALNRQENGKNDDGAK